MNLAFALVAALVGVGWLASAGSHCAEAGNFDEALLTPETMGGHGFSMSFKFTPQTVTAGSLPARPTGLIHVEVSFDTQKGEAIDKIEEVTLVLQDGGEYLLLVPIRTWPYPRAKGINWLQFSILKDLIPKAKLRLRERGEGQFPTFWVDVNAFYEKR